MQRKKPLLRLEHLEVRDTPASFSVSWADPTHLTVSSSPNGTASTTGIIDLSSHQPVSGLSAASVQGSVIKAMEQWSSQSALTVDFLMTTFNAPPIGSGTLGGASVANFSTEIKVSQGAVSYIGVPFVDPATNPGGTPPPTTFPYQDLGKWWLDYMRNLSA